jgi:hypothetical protein
MIQRTFSFKDQEAFAELSGDYNPLHLDQIFGRRLIFGHCVVHGVHSLLWALDCWVKDTQKKRRLTSLDVFFIRPVAVGEDVYYSLISEENQQTVLHLLDQKQSITTKINIGWAYEDNFPEVSVLSDMPEKQNSLILTEETISTSSGRFPLSLNIEKAEDLFSDLCRLIPVQQLAEIIATTRLIGMKCPGLHSIYSRLEVEFLTDSRDIGFLDYRVQQFDPRFKLAIIDITGDHLKGIIKAFLRPAPIEQPKYSEIKKRISKDEFKGQRALVVGGSRGLGEVVSKLLSAGGADVRLTYYKGVKEADAIVKEIRDLNGAVKSCFFNVLKPEWVLQDGWSHTHLYYFATPFIFGAQKGTFSSDLFRMFNNYYVNGFFSTVQVIQKQAKELRAVFYPSSVAIDELSPGMAEYVSSKIAGETLCGYLERIYKNLTIYKPRLPRLATDQTVSLLPVQNEDPVEVMGKYLRVFNHDYS